METIITAATVATMFFNMANTTTGEYAYNADIESGRVENMYVMKHDGKYLNNKLRYQYTYDEWDRLIQKEALLWNNETRSWEPDYCLYFAYTENGYHVERSEWDSKAQRYGDAHERMEYEMLYGNVVAVNTYERTSFAAEFELKTNMLVMNPQDRLLAEY